IEILKGAASSLYGSEAMGGVINIITDQPKNLINITSETRYAEENQFDQTVNLDINTGKFGSFTSYNRRQADGWQLNKQTVTYDSKGNEKLTDTDKQASDKFYSNVINQHFTYTATKALSFYARGSFYNKENDRPVTEYDYNLAYQDYSLGLGGKYLLGNANYLSLDLYNDNFEGTKEYIKDVTDKKGNVTTANGTSALNKRQHYYNANLKGVFKAGDFNKITIGTEYVNDKLKNPEALSGDKQVYTLALYSQDEIKLWQKLQAVVGLRYVYHETFKSKLTPKVSLMYSPGALNFRATYSSGFRAPSLEELYYNKEKNGTLSAGNINLKPEKSNYFSLNGEFINRLFSLSATAYVNKLNNLITSKQVDLTEADVANGISKRTEYQNVDKAQVKGVDVSINSYLGYGLSLGGSYSFADAKDTNTKTRLPRSVKHSGSINTNWNKTWDSYTLNINLAGRLQSERYETGSYGNAPDYQLWNLSTRHTFNNLKNFILEPGIGVENIFNYRDDRPYNSNYATLSPGRTFYVSLLLKFRK
ncbi:MAG: TonB-dependent receptor, partial [Porphyromonadaceae bacterium]|nr:TonB-dependent receptor [Porphyromonadaceae bacterium]